MASEVRIEDNTQDFLDGMDDQLAAALEEIGITAEGYAKMKCPVDTGNLRNSITHTTDDTSAYIGTNVEYAPYVEMGTTKTRAQPFLRPAAQDHTDVYKSIVERRLKS